MLMWNSRTVVAFRFRCHMVWLAQPIYNSSKREKRIEMKLFHCKYTTRQGLPIVCSCWVKTNHFFLQDILQQQIGNPFSHLHPFYSGHLPEFSPQESSLFQGIFCKKRERKSFEKMQGVPLFFFQKMSSREWNPCEILFQLKWSCHRVFCSQREMLLLLLTLISWTNFLSLGIKIWARHAKKLLFPIFHWAVVRLQLGQ